MNLKVKLQFVVEIFLKNEIFSIITINIKPKTKKQSLIVNQFSDNKKKSQFNHQWSS